MNVLVIAPHPDDEVLGAGGMIARHADGGDDVYVCIVTRGVQPMYPLDMVNANREEALRAHGILGVKETIFLDLPAVLLPSCRRHEINAAILGAVERVRPQTVYIPHRGDIHLDHKTVFEAAMVALRPVYFHKVPNIYAYETLSETGWDSPDPLNAFVPDVWMDIGGYITAKVNALRCYESQMRDFPSARSVKAVEALSQYRGSQMGMHNAEAFMLIRQLC